MRKKRKGTEWQPKAVHGIHVQAAAILLAILVSMHDPTYRVQHNLHGRTYRVQLHMSLAPLIARVAIPKPPLSVGTLSLMPMTCVPLCMYLM